MSNLTNCRSANAVNTIEDTISSSIANIIGTNVFWTDQEKDQIQKRFQEIFSEVLHKNITVDGKSWADAEKNGNLPPEMEPLDEEKRKYLNNEVYPSIGNQMMDTIKRRREYPYKCALQYRKKCRSDCMALDRLKTEVNVEALVDQEKCNIEELLSTALDSSKMIKGTTTCISSVEERAFETTTMMQKLCQH